MREICRDDNPRVHADRELGDLEQPVGLKGNRLKKRLAGSYFAAFSANRITIGLQNLQNLPSTSHFFAAILQVRQAASVSVPCLPQQQCCQYRCDSSEQAALAFLFGEYFGYFFVHRLCAIFI
ncbi:hypothetical protein NNRS527_01018 [Nitrosospira sp. NRS527]|nr:hypothetical protein NNRS527_01018 [Nitrosospira sp. NRS527]